MDEIRDSANVFSKGDKSLITPGKQLDNIVEYMPERIAIIEISREGVETGISWIQLRDFSNRIARMLKDKGVDEESTVVVSYPNGIAHIAATYAIWKLGACYVPIPHKTTEAELADMFEQLKPDFAMSDLVMPDDVPSCKIDELYDEADKFSSEGLPDILANPNMISLSGGSSGKPKLVRQNIPSGSSDASLRSWYEMSGMAPMQTQLLCGPLFHGAPHTAAFNGLFVGNTLIIPASMKAENIVKIIRDYKVEFMQMVPTMMHRIVKLPNLNPEDFRSLKAISHTGGVCSEWLKREWFKLIEPSRVYEIYSQTEVIGLCTIRGDQWLKHPGSVGLPHCGKVSVRDENGKELPPGEVGEIFMTPPIDFFYTEYLNSPPIELLEDGFRSVGDMGYVDGDGYLYFADRRSDIIVTGGENVFTCEVEEAIMSHPSVLDTVVVGIPDAEWGRRIHAVVEAQEEMDGTELKEYLSQRLLPYKIPKTFDFSQPINRKSNSKVYRERVLMESIQKETATN